MNTDLLGKISEHTESLAVALADPHFSTASVVVATCNRFETYLEVHRNEHLHRALCRIAEITGLSASTVQRFARLHCGHDAITHLISVATGLESVVTGEGEILGQMTRAWARARTAGTLSPELERLFRHAAHTSRDIRHRTGVQSAGRSIVRLALELVNPKIGDWASANILLAGTGRYAGVSLAALRDRGAARLSVYSPSGRAEQFAAAHGVRAVHESALEEAIAAADLVVTTSLAREPVLSTALFARSTRASRAPYCTHFGSTISPRRSPAKPRLVIDLGMPRNIAPDVTAVSGIELLDLDAIARHAPETTRCAETAARALVTEAAIEYEALQAEDAAVPAILALRGHINEILLDELGSIQNRPRSSANTNTHPRDHPTNTEAALRHFAARILHEPSVRIRQLGRRGDAECAQAAVRMLFGNSQSITSPNSTSSRRTDTP